MRKTSLFSIGLVLTGGCIGEIGGDRDGVGGENAAEAASGMEASRIFRLTLRQYDNTLRDLVALDAPVSIGFIADVGGTGFSNNASLLGVSTQQAAEFHQGAIDVAEQVMSGAIADLFPCPLDAMSDETCAKQFIADFGRRAFRRPLTDEESMRYVALYRQGRDQIDATMGVRIVVETMVQSPNFLFRMEIGDAKPGGVGELDDHELATALSYYLWDTMPDEELLSLADAGGLSRQTTEAQVERMLDDPRSRDAVTSFYGQLFEYDRATLLSRDPTTFPGFDAQLSSMVGELDAFVDHVVREKQSNLGELLTAPYAFVDAETAPLYGVAPPDGPGFTRVDLDPETRAGVLTQLGFLTIHATPKSSAPPRRGRFVIDRLLCLDIASPPDNVPSITPPDSGEPKTTRQTFEQHATDASCAGCHRLIDPPGFALENYDMLGRFRSEEAGLPVDASTSLAGLADLEGDIDGGVELSKALASSDAVRACVVRQSFRYAFGRSDTDDDEAFLEELGESFSDADHGLRALYAAVALSPRYRQRRFLK